MKASLPGVSFSLLFAAATAGDMPLRASTGAQVVVGAHLNNSSALQHQEEGVRVVVIWEGWTSDADEARHRMSTDS